MYICIVDLIYLFLIFAFDIIIVYKIEKVDKVSDNNNKNIISSTKKRKRLNRKLRSKIKFFVFILIMTITFFVTSTALKKVVNLSYKENSNINYLVYLKLFRISDFND